MPKITNHFLNTLIDPKKLAAMKISKQFPKYCLAVFYHHL